MTFDKVINGPQNDNPDGFVDALIFHWANAKLLS